MKTHYKIESMVPDYEIEAVFRGPSLKRAFVTICGSASNQRTTNPDNVTCKACIKKMQVKPSKAVTTFS